MKDKKNEFAKSLINVLGGGLREIKPPPPEQSIVLSKKDHEQIKKNIDGLFFINDKKNTNQEKPLKDLNNDSLYTHGLIKIQASLKVNGYFTGVSPLFINSNYFKNPYLITRYFVYFKKKKNENCQEN